MTSEVTTLIALNVALLLQLFGLWIAVMTDEYIEEKRRRWMFGIMGLLLLLILQGHMDTYTTAEQISVLGKVLISTLGYIVRPTVIALFIRIQNPNRNGRIVWTIVGINLLIHLISIPGGWVVDFTPDSNFVRGPLGYTSFVISGILILYLVITGLIEFQTHKKGDMVIPIFVSAVIVLSVAADIVTSNTSAISFLMMAMVSACVFYYIWLHMRFLHEHEKEMEDGQRIQIMMSQIQPHFLFNTLATVQALCQTDPERAESTLEKFGIYLRQNIDSLDNPELIPFTKELEHTKVYAEIEQIRFPSIEIIYDIEYEDFVIPALTIQPLVENAIRHGVRIRDHGIIRISVKEMRSNIRIIIEDNGKGFDVNAPNKDTTRSHIGMRNVKERIESMCYGTMAIESKIDEGTKITIKLPIN